MTARSRRPDLPLLLLLTGIVAACATGASPSSSADAPSDPTSPVASPQNTAEPGSSDPAPTEVAVTQTDTDWGRIWDDVPTGFPVYPGAGDAAAAEPEPVSATWAVEGGDALEIASWLQTALETATYSTEAMSGPLEDGSFVIESVGDGECRIRTTITPLGGMTFIAVHYGAACPID